MGHPRAHLAHSYIKEAYAQLPYCEDKSLEIYLESYLGKSVKINFEFLSLMTE